MAVILQLCGLVFLFVCFGFILEDVRSDALIISL